MEKSDSIIIIPTYNEKENIENIIRAVFGLEKFFHILIIEDSSPDGTAAIEAGAPKNCIQWIEEPSIEATVLLMNHPKIATVLATGGPGMVKAAYSTG